MIITKNSQNERLVQKVCELLKRSSTNLKFFFNYLKNLVTDIAPPPALRPGTTVPPCPPLGMPLVRCIIYFPSFSDVRVEVVVYVRYLLFRVLFDLIKL